MTTLFFFTGPPATTDAVRRGLIWLARPGLSSPLLVAPTKSQFESNQMVEVLGAAKARALASGKPFLIDRTAVRTETYRTLRPSDADRSAVLLLWPNRKVLESFSKRVQPVCVVPWIKEDVDLWVRTVGAVNVTTGAAVELPAEEKLDGVVREAIRSLTVRVNLSTGLAHPDDRALAIDVFKTLNGGGYTFQEAGLLECLLSNGWTGKAAREVADIAAGVAAGKQFRTKGSSTVPPDSIARWKERASKQ